MRAFDYTLLILHVLIQGGTMVPINEGRELQRLESYSTVDIPPNKTYHHESMPPEPISTPTASSNLKPEGFNSASSATSTVMDIVAKNEGHGNLLSVMEPSATTVNLLSGEYSPTGTLTEPGTNERIVQAALVPDPDIPAGVYTTSKPTESVDRRYGQIVRPAFFYAKRPKVKCWNVDYIMARTPPANGWPIFLGGNSGIRPIFDTNNPADRELAQSKVDLCKRCRCDPDDELGLLQGRPYNKCSPNAARKCMSWYGCRCHVDLIQPEPTPTYPATLEEWQAALDGIPAIIKAHNPDYRWTRIGESAGDPSFYMTWAQNWKLAADTEEPYHLEGPIDEHTWEWAQGKSSFDLGGLGVMGSSPGGIMGPGVLGGVYRRTTSEDDPSTTTPSRLVHLTEDSKPLPLPENQSLNPLKSLFKNPVSTNNTTPSATPTKSFNQTLRICLDWFDIQRFPDTVAKLSESDIESQKQFDMLVHLCHRDCRCVHDSDSRKGGRYGCQRQPQQVVSNFEPLIRYCELLCSCGTPGELIGEHE